MTATAPPPRQASAPPFRPTAASWWTQYGRFLRRHGVWYAAAIGMALVAVAWWLSGSPDAPSSFGYELF